jgi:hypothetical protein
MRTKNKTRRLNGDHEPHSNGHIYDIRTLRNFVGAGTLDQSAQHHFYSQ